jgi:integral membrane sensor domain MASE1
MYGRDNKDIQGFRRRYGQLWLTAACLYFLMAAATIHLTSNGRDIATIWPANAVLLALLLVHDRSAWPSVLSAGLIANAAANLVTRGTIVGPMLYGLSNVLEVTVAASVFGRNKGCVPILGSAGVVVRFLLACGLLAPGLSGFFGAMTARLFFGQPFALAFKTWFVSDALGLLIFTPSSSPSSTATLFAASGKRTGSVAPKPSACSRWPA